LFFSLLTGPGPSLIGPSFQQKQVEKNKYKKNAEKQAIFIGINK